MTLILFLLTLGFAVGHFLRSRPACGQVISKLTDLSIYMLLFLLGISVAATPDLNGNLLTLGIPALILSISGVTGSCLLAMLVQRWIRIDESPG